MGSIGGGRAGVGVLVVVDGGGEPEPLRGRESGVSSQVGVDVWICTAYMEVPLYHAKVKRRKGHELARLVS